MAHTALSSRRGSVTPLLLAGVGAVVLVGGAAWFMSGDGDASSESMTIDVHAVSRGSFKITVPAAGELAALNQIEIVNQLESRAVITEIVAEGDSVRKGDILIRLAEEETRDRIKDAEDKVNTSEASLVAAESNLEIRKSAGKSEIDKANLRVELAELAFRAWEEGDLKRQQQQHELAERTAQINYDRLRAKFIESQKLLEDEFISKDEYERDRIALIEAESRLKQAELDKKVYEDFTKQRQEKQMRSDVEQAIADRDRVDQRVKAELETFEADVASKKHQFTSSKERLEKLERQLQQCVVRATSDGLVVYASSMESGGWRGNDDEPPRVGTELRPNETVIILPDTSQMIAKVKVNEALSGLIERGQRATIVSDAVPGRAIEGEVLGVGVLAESGGWRDPNRRDYTVRVLLKEGADLGLKPSMRCKAEIHVGDVDEVLHIPIQAVHHKGRNTLVYVQNGGDIAERAVATGRANETLVEVTDGLIEGEFVLLRRPMPHEVTRELDIPKPDGKGGDGQQPNVVARGPGKSG